MSQKLILVFFGSPHRSGNTAQILGPFLKAFESDRSFQIRIIDAYEEEISPCTACGACKRREMCSKHDFDEIDLLLRKADVLVFATPVYNLSVPSPLKAILDRTQRYYEARFSLNKKPPIEKHKHAVLMITMGSSRMDGPEIIEKQLRMIFTVLNTELDQVIVWADTDQEDAALKVSKVRAEVEAAALAIKAKI